MNSKPPSYRGVRFPPEIISHAVWKLSCGAPDGGRLTIETTPADLGQDYAATHQDLSPGIEAPDYVTKYGRSGRVKGYE